MLTSSIGLLTDIDNPELSDFGHDPALEPDVEQREQYENDEDHHRLEQDQPPGVLAEGREVVAGGGQRDDRVHACPPVTVTRLPGEARSARTPRLNELAGTQTVPSAMSAISAGSVTEPRSPVSVTIGPTAS